MIGDSFAREKPLEYRRIFAPKKTCNGHSMTGVRERRSHIDPLSARVEILSLDPVDFPSLKIRNRDRAINRGIQCDRYTIVMLAGHGGQWVNCRTS